MDGDHARFRGKVNENGGILPWMETRCWEWTGATDKTGRWKGGWGQWGQFGHGAGCDADPGGQDAAARGARGRGLRQPPVRQARSPRGRDAQGVPGPEVAWTVTCRSRIFMRLAEDNNGVGHGPPGAR